jgi:hypothetical protein
MALDFRFYPLGLLFRTRQPLRFPEGAAANVLRGAFGTLLEGEAYQRIFAPSRDQGPSGLADAPRPFVVRASHLDGRSVEEGELFSFQIPYFETNCPMIDNVVRAFEGWNRAELIEVTGRSPLSIDLERCAPEVDRVTVSFLTPTELKVEGRLAPQPEFGILAARIRDRLSTLRALYGEGALAIDFREFAARAARVRMTRCELHQIDTRRRSSRTGQTHSIGGFTGDACYEGTLAEFVPYLRAAEWTGVGRQTVWGKGAIAGHC